MLLKKNNRHLVILPLLLLVSALGHAQNFPRLGNDTLLDVACWNVEWLGDTQNGPSDETLQYNNVKALLDKTDLDVIALEEISNASTYNTLSTALAAKYDTYISDYSQTQKTGIYWKKNMFSLLPDSSGSILLDQAFNFGGRPPLRVALKTLGGTKTDTLYFIVLHMKAFATEAAYNNRSDGSKNLKTFLDAQPRRSKIIVLGDWNDDLDQSIYNSMASPYKNLLDGGYKFSTLELTQAGKSSYAFSSNMIDHQLMSKSLDSFYFTGSARVFDEAPSYCTGFSNNTSDHYPVYSFFNWKKLTTSVIPEGIADSHHQFNLKVYPNPSVSYVEVQCDKPMQTLRLTNVWGEIMPLNTNFTSGSHQCNVSLQELKSGIYFLQVLSIEGEHTVILVRP